MNSRSSSSAEVSAEDAKGYTLAAMPPTAFGKYVLVGKLGHGGMAEVNLAVTGGKGGFRKLFVIKRLHAHLEAEPGFVDMFLDEARLAAQLDHPHCVQTVEVGEVGGQHFLAMEYLDGQGLERLLRMAAAKNEPLPPAMAARICLDALDGLGYAHELSGFDGQPLGVVHRDISPQNLFVTYTGVVKVLDFGIAKAASNVVETRTGVIKGKYAYIAPEQALANNLDARADLWSMGVVFWELLTTRRLFKSVNELATLQETLRGDIHPPSSVQPNVPPELDAIAMRALQRDPNQRYPSAAAFKADLEGWLSRQPKAPDRRSIAALMTERFGDIMQLQKQKLRECLAAVAQGENSVERLIEAGGVLASAELAAMSQSSPGLYTPSGAVVLPTSAPQGHGPYPTPTPYPSNPYVAPYPSNPYVAPPPTPYPSNPYVAPPGHLQQPPPPEQRRRAVGWWLVGVGALAIAAVLGAVLMAQLGGGGTPDEGTVAISVVGGTPANDPGSISGTGTVLPGAPSEPSVGPVAVPPITVPDVVVAPEAVVVGSSESEGSGSGSGGSGSGSRRSGRGRRGGEGEETAADAEAEAGAASSGTTAPGGTVVPPSGTEEPPATGEGFLTMATSPWTSVTCDGRSLGDTPLVHVSLPSGRHSCRLVNAAEGISESYDVTIRPGETTRVRLGLR
jgi:serine/threonine-protein kinase